MKPLFAELPSEAVEKIEMFIEQYLTYAYRQNRLRWHPQGKSDIDIYREVIELYSSQGFAYTCMRLILQEHHSNGEREKTESDLFTEFRFRQWLKNFTHGGIIQVRRAVNEMLRYKSGEQCKQMAIATMERVRSFSQMIYTDEVVKHLRANEFTKDADQRESDGKWLRDVAQRAALEAFSDRAKLYSMRFYFGEFVSLLQDMGRFWAAQLLVHGIDMRELETFIPENAQGEEITSKKFKDQCSLQFAYLVETIKKVIGGKEKSYTLRTPLSAWGIVQSEDEGTGENGGISDNDSSQGGSNSGSGSGSVTPSNGGSQTETVEKPTISGNTSFAETTSVSMSGPAGAEIHYTTNGILPTAESQLYSEPFTLSETTTVKAIAIKNGVSSQVATKYFTKTNGGDDNWEGDIN